LLARALSFLPGVDVGAALVAVANLAALVGTGLLVVLVRRETGSLETARRAAWIVCLAPPAFALVMGYSESTLFVFTAATFIALRSRRYAWAGLFGLLAGLTRPIGALLVIPALVEALRGEIGVARLAGSVPRVENVPAGREGAHGPGVASRPAERRPAERRPAERRPAERRPAELISRLAAVAGPLIGTGSYLAWVGWRYGDMLAPVRIQFQGAHHGHLADPLATLAHDASLLVHGHHLGTGLHLPWVVLALGLLWVALRRLPLSYGIFAAGVLVVALTASNLDSFERYALSAMPLAIAGALLTTRPAVERTVLLLASGGLVAYAVLAFLGLYVP
jgi:hypothetical protein